MDRHSNLIMEEIAERLEHERGSLERSVVDTFLEGVAKAISVHVNIPRDVAREAVASTMASMIREGLLERLEQPVPDDVQEAWCRAADLKGLVGRAVDAARLG